MKYKKYLANQRAAAVYNLQCSSVLNERQLQRDLLAACSLKVCDEEVADRPILQCSLQAKNNKSYAKLMTFSEFTQRQTCLSITGEHLFAVCDRCNKTVSSMGGHGRHKVML